MFVPDLAPHPDVSGVLAVGWLERGQAHAKGAVPETFVDALFEACLSKEVRLTRGWHRCDLCDDVPRPTIETWKGRSASFGHSEIEVIAADGVRYGAPQLIVHYVVSHHYQPPAAFVDAVLRGEFVEEVYAQVRDLARMDDALAQALRHGLVRRLGLAEELADRIDVRIALATITRSFAAHGTEDVRWLRVAQQVIEVPWDGSAAGALAILETYCESHELAFDEHWATWVSR